VKIPNYLRGMAWAPLCSLILLLSYSYHEPVIAADDVDLSGLDCADRIPLGFYKAHLDRKEFIDLSSGSDSVGEDDLNNLFLKNLDMFEEISVDALSCEEIKSKFRIYIASHSSYMWGLSASRAGYDEEAVAKFESAFKGLNLLEDSLGYPDQEIKDFLEVMQIEYLTSIQALNSYAASLGGSGQIDKASAAFDELVILASKKHAGQLAPIVSSYQKSGEFHVKNSGNYSRAIELFDKGLAAFPAGTTLKDGVNGENIRMLRLLSWKSYALNLMGDRKGFEKLRAELAPYKEYMYWENQLPSVYWDPSSGVDAEDSLKKEGEMGFLDKIFGSDCRSVSLGLVSDLVGVLDSIRNYSNEFHAVGYITVGSEKLPEGEADEYVKGLRSTAMGLYDKALKKIRFCRGFQEHERFYWAGHVNGIFANSMFESGMFDVAKDLFLVATDNFESAENLVGFPASFPEEDVNHHANGVMFNTVFSGIFVLTSLSQIPDHDEDEFVRQSTWVADRARLIYDHESYQSHDLLVNALITVADMLFHEDASASIPMFSDALKYMNENPEMYEPDTIAYASRILAALESGDVDAASDISRERMMLRVKEQFGELGS